MKTVLIVSPQFPPNPLAGVHRARHLAKHLPAHGWWPIVIRVDERFYEEAPDAALADLVPRAVEQIRVGALDTRIARRIGLGDLGIRAYSQLRAALDRAAAEHHASAVLITGFPFYPMLLTGHIRDRLGLPVVLDFQDPWVSAWGATQPALSKAGLAHRLAVMLEPRAVRRASFITGVSEQQNTDMAARYPWLDKRRMAAIPIGGDPEDFPTERPRAVGRAVLRSVGAYWPRAEPCVRALFGGLALLRQGGEAPHLRFIGTWTGAQDAAPRLVQGLAQEAGVADCVDEEPRRAPFIEAMSLLAGADGLILYGSDEPHYSASKIYPTLMSGRPYLAIFHARSSAYSVLRQAGGGIVLGFETQADLDALSPQIAEGLARLAREPESFGRPDPAAYAPFTAHAVAGRFAAIFDEVSA